MADATGDLPKHLEFIQDIIDRHARTSFLVKGWSVTLVAAIFLLAVRGADPLLAMAAGLLPAFSFWGLDAYYLRLERMYRKLYDDVRKRPVDPLNRFDLDCSPVTSRVDSWWWTLMAPTVGVFHVAIVVVVAVALAFFSVASTNAA